jgi:hypothetical protein
MGLGLMLLALNLVVTASEPLREATCSTACSPRSAATRCWPSSSARW